MLPKDSTILHLSVANPVLWSSTSTPLRARTPQNKAKSEQAVHHTFGHGRSSTLKQISKDAGCASRHAVAVISFMIKGGRRLDWRRLGQRVLNPKP